MFDDGDDTVVEKETPISNLKKVLSADDDRIDSKSKKKNKSRKSPPKLKKK